MEQKLTPFGETTAQTLPQKPEESVTARRVGYMVAILVNCAVLYAAHHLLEWGVPFLTQDWTRVLPAFDLSIGATILCYVVYYTYDAAWVRHLGQIAQNVLGLRAMLATYLIFPFAFRVGTVAQTLRIGMVFVMAAMAIATLVEVIKLALGRE